MDRRSIERFLSLAAYLSLMTVGTDTGGFAQNAAKT
jgi:hypothetical protein